VWGGWFYTQQQYYVGVDHDQVVVMRGIPGEIAGLRLSSVYRRPDTTVHVNQLKKHAQDRVKEGISASSAADAWDKLSKLLAPGSDNFCDPSASPAPSPGAPDASAGPSGGVSPSPTGSPALTPSAPTASSPGTDVAPSPTLPPC
jgi:protein phosphatase